MPSLIWHPDALEDIARLYDFLAPASLAAARRSASVIAAAADRIAENPGIGAPHAEFREWATKFGRSAYILRYCILSNGDALITRVWHSRELRSD
jgi:plasmid stabilization system protein ParE